MLIMESKVKIRRLYFVKGQSIKELMREFNLSRNTVRSIVRAENADSTYKRTQDVSSKLNKFKEILNQLLISDHKLPRKQRRTAMRYYDALTEKGYQGAYDSVQRYVKTWKVNAKEKLKAYIPLVFDAGEAYQFDWSDEFVQIAGVDYKVKAAHFRLCYSRKFFVIVYLRETQEMLFDAHNKAFAFFGGIPLRGIYDNLKTAIDTVLVGKDRIFNLKFLSLMDHYLIEPTACNPAAGWEKGQVERQVDIIRNWLFLPKLKFNTLEDLNDYLLLKCSDLATKKIHPENKNQTIEEVYLDEKQHLRPLHHPYISYREIACKVSSSCLVTFDRNRYSVDCAYANQVVSVKTYPDKIEAFDKDKCIGSHARLFGRDKTSFHAIHYLDLLERKPGALRNGRPFKEWDLPKSIEIVKTKMIKEKGGDKAFVDVLSAIPEHGVEAVNVACELAIESRVITRDYILNAVNRLRASATASTIEIPQELKLNIEPMADCKKYNRLLQGDAHVVR